MFQRKVFFIILFFINSLIFADSANITLDSLADICEAIEKSILDITIDYELVIDPPPQKHAGLTVVTGGQKYKWSGAQPFTELSKSSCDFSVENEYGDSWDVKILQSYNGKVAKQYQLDGWPDRSSEGTITDKRNFKPIKSSTPLVYTVHHFVDQSFSLSQLLREKEKVTVSLDNNIIKVNNFDAICVSIYAHIENKNVLAQRIFFSPEHNFTLVKIEYFNGKTSAGSFDVLELKEVEEGVWFPVKGCNISSDANTPKNIFQADNIVLNQGIANDFFDIDFPSGTEVHDEITGLRYLIRPSEEQFDNWLKEEEIISEIESKKTNVINKSKLSSNLFSANPNFKPCAERNGSKASDIKAGLLLDNPSNMSFWYKIALVTLLLIVIVFVIFILKKIIKRGRAR